MYEEAKYAHGLLIYGYSRLPYRSVSETDIATDDAVSNVDNAFRTMTTGTWASTNDPMSQWVACKDGIQYVNLFLRNVSKVKWALSADSKQQMFIDRLKGEAFGLRAIFYYHLLQAHAGYADDGELYGVPLLIEPEDASSDFNQPRATFAKCVKQCFEDCDSAIALLPLDYNDIDSVPQIPEKYRKEAQVSNYNLILGNKAKNLISGRTAEAVKAQIALLAASPAYRDKSGVSSEDAAKACAAVLEHVKDKGLDPQGNVWYSLKTRLDANADMDEIIWRADRSIDHNQETSNFPPSLYGRGNINPSQNLVDAFPMLDGFPKDHAKSTYDPQNPYANRDPRLAKYIVYHGSVFHDKVISTGSDLPDEEGKMLDNIGESDNKTRTGYYLKKLLYEKTAISGASLSDYYHFYPRIRYTEIFLAYAEAANDAWGPKDDRLGVGSAYDIIKAIRKRAGIPADVDGVPLERDEYLEECASDKNKMTELIRNERRLELCFENKRFWDLRRWMMPLNESVKGMRVTLDPNKTDGSLIYTVIDVEDRKFDSSYQWYGPIPNTEILKWSNLKQNKGWK